MSQFITTSGKYVELVGSGQIKLVPASAAQTYISKLAEDIQMLDGGDVYLLDDSCTGTSEDVFNIADDQMIDKGHFDNTLLDIVLAQLYRAGHTIRIWWADNDPLAYTKVIDCGSLESFKSTLVAQHPTFRARLAANQQMQSTQKARD